MLGLAAHLCAIFLALSAVSAGAEIYRTVDEAGNTVFTDTPPEAEAEKVELPESNIADSVEVREHEPPPERPAAQPAPEVAEEAPTSRTVVNDDPDIVPVVRRQRPLDPPRRDPPRRPVARPAR